MGVFVPSPEDGNRSNFGNVGFSSIQNVGRWTEFTNPVSLGVTPLSEPIRFHCCDRPAFSFFPSRSLLIPLLVRQAPSSNLGKDTVRPCWQGIREEFCLV
jgi:hypothetical protein